MLIESTRNVITPIACKLCNFATYISFDFVIHSYESHHIGHGYLDTPATPSTKSRSWSDDYRIAAAISEGKEMGARLNDKTIEKLDSQYSKYLDKEKRETPEIVDHSIQVMAYGGLPRPWSQLKKFTPIISVETFFEDDDKPYSALKPHPLESLYYCELCDPEVANVNLSSIEHHCRYKEGHKAEILRRLSERCLI